MMNDICFSKKADRNKFFSWAGQTAAKLKFDSVFHYDANFKNFKSVERNLNGLRYVIKIVTLVYHLHEKKQKLR